MLEETVLNIFEEIGVPIDPVNVEGCHRIKSRSDKPDKIIIKLSRRKDCENIMLNKNKLKQLDNFKVCLPEDSKVFIMKAFVLRTRNYFTNANCYGLTKNYTLFGHIKALLKLKKKKILWWLKSAT